MSMHDQFGDLAASAARAERDKKRNVVVGALVVGLAASAALIFTGIKRGGVDLAAFASAGGLGVVVCVVGAGLVYGFWRSGGRSADGELKVQVEQLTRTMEQLVEHGALSEEARRVVNRRRDREILCRAIQEDIEAEDWDAAMVLVKELA